MPGAAAAAAAAAWEYQKKKIVAYQRVRVSLEKVRWYW